MSKVVFTIFDEAKEIDEDFWEKISKLSEREWQLEYMGSFEQVDALTNEENNQPHHDFELLSDTDGIVGIISKVGIDVNEEDLT